MQIYAPRTYGTFSGFMNGESCLFARRRMKTKISARHQDDLTPCRGDFALRSIRFRLRRAVAVRPVRRVVREDDYAFASLVISSTVRFMAWDTMSLVIPFLSIVFTAVFKPSSRLAIVCFCEASSCFCEAIVWSL